MSCDTCNSGPAALERAYAEILIKAREYVQKQQKAVFTYFDPVQGWGFIQEDFAAGYPNRRELIPYTGGAAAG